MASMFTAPVIALLAALSASAWTYSMAMRRSGNNSQTAGIVSALAGVISFIIVWSIVSLIDDYLGQ